MGGGGGGSNEVRETAQQQAAAEVAAKQWNMYQQELKPFENLFMDKVSDLNKGQEYDQLAGEAGLGYASSFGKARSQAGDELAAAGVDPTSGKYQSIMDELTGDQMVGQADTVARAQTSQQDKYVAGLKDIAAIGQGQKAEAMQGYQNISAMAHNKASAEAQMAHQKKLSSRAATAGLVGSLAGAATSYGLGQAKAPAMSPGSTGEQLSSASLSQNQLYNPQAATHVGGR
ncbi:hypothetical protein HNR62_001023 [Oceanisphaera litoralis]|uniref:hypothetical protein n=1 Tax=Oceanisphaera litoralis TaxID=225144 RepID=UPI00195A98B3|nr:hypothetical protein [Oceanisphaera litoralis]MBM7455163.1 hypothetical protein [Oceanisphaera litoralis]